MCVCPAGSFALRKKEHLLCVTQQVFPRRRFHSLLLEPGPGCCSCCRRSSRRSRCVSWRVCLAPGDNGDARGFVFVQQIITVTAPVCALPEDFLFFSNSEATPSVRRSNLDAPRLSTNTLQALDAAQPSSDSLLKGANHRHPSPDSLYLFL